MDEFIDNIVVNIKRWIIIIGVGVLGIIGYFIAYQKIACNHPQFSITSPQITFTTIDNDQLKLMRLVVEIELLIERYNNDTTQLECLETIIQKQNDIIKLLQPVTKE